MLWRVGLISWLVLVSSSSWANTLNNIRVWPAPHETRVVIDMAFEPSYSYLTLKNPDRIVLDLNDTSINFSLPKTVKNSQILSKIRKSTPQKKGAYRLVFELKNKSALRIFKLEPNGAYGHRVVIDFPHKKTFTTPKVITKKTTSIAKPDAKTSVISTPAVIPSETKSVPPLGTADIIVAIDPGHGGNDPGAIGPRRKYEKHITLSIARQLRSKINAIPGMKAVLTRDGDYFVDLNKRTEIARKQGAHLLVSIHADGYHTSQPRGASVWVLSRRRANSEIGRWIEKHEEQSNLLGGGALLNNNEDEYLSRAVLDLQFSNSQKEGYEVATRVLKEMGKVTKLHKSSPEHASLAVLKSPDIPSLLVEAGFITNPEEETLLLTTWYQQKISNAVYKGVLAYFKEFPPYGTLMAQKNKSIKHRVLSGQSLSVIAQKYNTTISTIKTANSLKSNTVKTGQILTIPTRSILSTQYVQASSNTKSTAQVHLVKSGDFLSQIAYDYGVTTKSIHQNNHLSSDKLLIGQKLKIYGGTLKNKQHKVKRGDYLGKIANNYGVTIKNIRLANRLRSDELEIGQTLIIPGR